MRGCRGRTADCACQADHRKCTRSRCAHQAGAYASDFQSIPRTFWWALVTMTTVGYGDVSPITPMGRFVAVFTMFSGIIIVALPITVIGANFEKQFEKQFFADQLVNEVTKEDGTVDHAKMMDLLRTLDMRGNLQVPLPASEADLAELIAQYDVQGKGRLDNDDWASFIMDTMCEAHEFTGETINKLVLDVDRVREEARSLREQVSACRRASDSQYEELRALLLGEPPPLQPRQLNSDGSLDDVSSRGSPAVVAPAPNAGSTRGDIGCSGSSSSSSSSNSNSSRAGAGALAPGPAPGASAAAERYRA